MRDITCQLLHQLFHILKSETFKIVWCVSLGFINTAVQNIAIKIKYMNNLDFKNYQQIISKLLYIKIYL